MMKFTAQQIAMVVQGSIEGDPQATVSMLAKIEDAKPGSLCFLSNPKYEDHLYTTTASVVLVNKSLQLKKEIKTTLIRVDDAYVAFARLLQTYNDLIGSQAKTGIEQPSYISPTAKIAENVYIGAFAYIGDQVVISKGAMIYPNTYIGDHSNVGEGSIIYAGVKIYKDTSVGERVIIHSGCVIGSDGFGFALEGGVFKKIPQMGNVKICDDVEIGSNSTIDRATLGSTVIGKGVKIDILVQVAHNVEVGDNSVIAAQAGISGSTRIGKNCMIGGQAGLVGHIQIADGTRINAQSGVAKSIEKTNTSLTGSPAYDYKSTLKSQVVFRNLPEMQQRINELEKKIDELLGK